MNRAGSRIDCIRSALGALSLSLLFLGACLLLAHPGFHASANARTTEFTLTPTSHLALPPFGPIHRVAAIAPDSCSKWLWQKEGLYWRLCVRDDGTQYCQEADNEQAKNIRTVPCNP
jgi:hypothetical protein